MPFETDAVRVVGLSKAYGSGDSRVQALQRISLQIAVGELVALTGPSGSGKSTLLAAIGGLEPVDSGEVHVFGAEVTTMRDDELHQLRRRSIGYVFQDYNLVRNLTAAENVSLPAELDGRPVRKARTEAAAALEAVGLAGLGRRFPDELSGGQRQRVAIARALVGTQRLLLADEPTGALDSETAELVLGIIADRVREGVTAILVTHDEKVAAHAHRTLQVLDGRLVEG
jgi:putative ABC transport system ATP-binding protein